MNVYRLGEDRIERDPYGSVTIGTFDGVHKGHYSILKKVLEGGHSTVVTFDPHPQHVMRNFPDKIKIITPVCEKLRKLELLGIERTIIIPFNREFSSITAEYFLETILMKTIGLKRLVVGFNHSFGKGRAGDTSFLKAKSGELGFELFIMDPYQYEGTTISSTLIRKTLKEGNIAAANSYLGNPFRLIGTVVKGQNRGKRLGYPTANISLIDPEYLVPAEGVYTAMIYHAGKKYPGVVSIGTCSTFGEHPLVIEAHLFDVTLDLYGEELHVELLDHLRPQQKFDAPDELVKQMRLDEKNARQLLMQ